VAREVLRIRAIKNDDVSQVVELWLASGISRPWNDPLKDIAFARASPQSVILIGARDERIVATTMVGEDGHRGWVYYVATHPEVQRQGVARDMMAAAEAWLKARGIWRMQLLVREDNTAAKGFYERLGYRDTKTTCFQKVIDGDPASGDAR
jgi:ribosomal protein S18 acetylase RimI-like enzyme